VHTHPGTKRGLDVQRILDDSGVDARRVVLAHSGDSTDADHLSELAEAGFYLGMDRFGIELEVPFADRVGIVVELCRRGYADRLVLSHDASCYIDWVDPGLMAALPNWHYLHIHNNVLPALRAAGVTAEQIRQMLVDNPRHYFETRDAT
jgi:phosphotriesterase-related protein